MLGGQSGHENEYLTLSTSLKNLMLFFTLGCDN